MSFALSKALAICAVAAAAAACSGPGSAVPNSSPAGSAASGFGSTTVRNAAPGPILSTSDGGQIFGFDIDQQGNDGVLASFDGSSMSVQTFNKKTGKIIKTFAVRKGRAPNRGDDYVADGISAGDVGLVDHQIAGQPGVSPAKDVYEVLNPVTGNKFTQKWTAPGRHFNVTQQAVNQTTRTAVLYGYERVGSDAPELVVSDIAANTTSNVIHLDPNKYSLANEPQLAQDTANDAAIVATSPSGGAAGGPPPLIASIDLKSGKATEFAGVDCPGILRCGYALGIGYDSNTGIACTTTVFDGGVEFYHVAAKTGTHALMPNGGGQNADGGYVIADQMHKLFLIAQPFSSTAPSGSSIQVYGEDGTFVESVNGLDFTNSRSQALPLRIAIDPRRRIGWVNGPQVNQLQQFSY
ncbi:MAG TPA: hypothetical protein VIJ77_06180 [Candidatus Tumulicola sp.]